MNKHKTHDQTEVPASNASRRPRLDALLFTAASLGTTLLTLGATVDPKIPPFVGE